MAGAIDLGSIALGVLLRNSFSGPAGEIVSSANNLRQTLSVGFEAGGIGVATAAIVKLGAAAVDLGANLQQSQQAIAAWGAMSQQQANQVSQAFVGSAGQFTQSITDELSSLQRVLPILQQMSGGYVDVGKAMGVMQAASALSVTTGSSLQSSTSSMVDVMRTYGESLGNAGKVAGTMAATTELTGTSVEQQAMSIDRLRDRYGALAPSLDQASTLTVQFAEAGVTGQRGMMIMESGVDHLMSGSKDASDQLARMGISMYDAQGNMKNWGDLFPQIVQGLQGLTQQSRIEAEQALFGSQSAAAWDSVIRQGTSGIKEASDALKDHSDIMGQSAEMTNTLSGAWDRFKNVASSAVLGGGTTSSPTVSQSGLPGVSSPGVVPNRGGSSPEVNGATAGGAIGGLIGAVFGGPPGAAIGLGAGAALGGTIAGAGGPSQALQTFLDRGSLEMTAIQALQSGGLSPGDSFQLFRDLAAGASYEGGDIVKILQKYGITPPTPDAIKQYQDQLSSFQSAHPDIKGFGPSGPSEDIAQIVGPRSQNVLGNNATIQGFNVQTGRMETIDQSQLPSFPGTTITGPGAGTPSAQTAYEKAINNAAGQIRQQAAGGTLTAGDISQAIGNLQPAAALTAPETLPEGPQGAQQNLQQLAQANQLFNQSNQEAAQGSQAVAQALRDEANAAAQGVQDLTTYSNAVSNAQAAQQLLLTQQQNRATITQLGLQAQLAGIQGTPGIAAALQAEQAAYASNGGNGDVLAEQRAQQQLGQAQVQQQIAAASTQRQTEPMTLNAQASVAAAQGMSGYAEALQRAAAAAASGTPEQIAMAQALAQVAQSGYQVEEVQNQLAVTRIQAGTGATQTQTQLQQQQFSFIATPPQLQQSLGPAMENYATEAQRVIDLNHEINTSTDPDQIRELGMQLQQAQANLQGYSAALELVKNSATGMGQALMQAFNQPTSEESAGKLQEAATNLKIAQIEQQAVSQTGAIPKGGSDAFNAIMGLTRSLLPVQTAEGVETAQRQYYGAQVQAAQPAFSNQQLAQLASQYIPQLPGYVPNPNAPVTPATTPQTPQTPNTVTSGGLHVTVNVNGEEVGEAYAQQMFEGMSMQVGVAPGGASSGAGVP